MTAALYWLIGSCLVLNAVYSLPIDDGAIDYLRNYGYLPTTSSRFGAEMLHEDTAKDALKALQKLGNIEETGVLDDATKDLLRKPRCGNPDFEITQNPTRRRRQKRYALGPSHWENREITWKFMNINHPRSGREYSQILRLIREAMEIWQYNSNLKLREVRENSADILIDFAQGNHNDNFDFHGPGGSLAHAFYPGSGLGGDVHLDNEESWDIENGDGNDGDVSFFYTLLHELGHSLGLAHSSTTDSIMYPWYSNQRTFDRNTKELFDDDQWGIQQIYGTKDGKAWGPINRHKTTRRITTTSTQRPRTRPYLTEPTTTHSPKPDKCDTSIDAIGIIRNELMVFKGVYMWRFRDDQLLQGYPVEFHNMWDSLRNFDHIDAVFERTDGKFVFFHDQDVMVIDSGRKGSNLYNLEDLGFDRKVKKIDAIFRWGYNNKTYAFSGEDYWKLNDELHVDQQERHEYPRKISTIWKKVKSIKIDTAFQKDGVTYFFSDKMFYKFNDRKMTLEADKPQVTSQVWMHCHYSDEEITSIQKSARIQNESDIETSSATPSNPSTTTVSHHHFVTKKTFIGVLVFSDDAFPASFETTTKATGEGLPQTSTVGWVGSNETTTKVSVESETKEQVKDFRIHFPPE